MKLTKNIFVLLVIILPFGKTIAQSWMWGTSGDGVGVNEGLAVCSDLNGNGFVTGYFESPNIVFGADTLNLTATYNGSGNIFLTKYDPNGNVLWSQSGDGSGGAYPDASWAVCTDDDGNVFITGGFWSPTITFDTITLISSDTSALAENVFVVKFDPNGHVLWGRTGIGGQPYSYNKGHGLSTDANGNVYVTGELNSSTITFDTIALTGPSLFIAKYDSVGNLIWAHNTGGKGYEIKSDDSGNFFVAGVAGGSVLLQKYDTNGNYIWGHYVSGGQALSVTTDQNQDVYITGDFYGATITFDSYILHNNDSTGIGYSDVFIVKYDSSGNVVWAKSGNGEQFDEGYSISADNYGNIFVSGGFYISSSTTVSDYIAFGNDTLFVPAGSSDPAFLLKLDQAGNILCASALASGGDDQNGVCAIQNEQFGSAYFGGDFISSPFVFGPDSLINTGSEAIFIAKYNCDEVFSIDDISNKNLVTIYPNPFYSQTTIQSKEFLHDASIILTNSTGAVIKEYKNVSGSTITFQADGLPIGLYFLRIVESNRTIKVAKLLIGY